MSKSDNQADFCLGKISWSRQKVITKRIWSVETLHKEGNIVTQQTEMHQIKA